MQSKKVTVPVDVGPEMMAELTSIAKLAHTNVSTVINVLLARGLRPSKRIITKKDSDES